ncbi:MAG: type II toxin-antitoxin system PemK/MazF family toxin [Verrucomicrobia bacterium]|nr:type II toxin-antitoxin system PemK/MazF family toxin [Verrucomicrobiota bacterium]
MTPKRGQIWWINLDPTVGSEIKKQRPCVVVSHDTVNRLRRTPVVVPLSQSPEASPPVVVALPSAGRDSVAVVDQIRAVDKQRFVSAKGFLSSADLAVLQEAIGRVLDLPH